MTHLLRLNPTLSACCIGLSLTLSWPLAGQSPDAIGDTSEQIGALRAKIKTLQQRLASQEEDRNDLQAALREAETRMSVLDQKLMGLNGERAHLQQKIEQLDKEGEQLRSAQQQRVDNIDASIQQLWLLQQGGGFRVWLGDQNPEDVARNLAYFQMAIEAQQQSIEAYEQGFEAIMLNRDAIAQTEIALQEQSEAVEDARDALAVQRQVRRVALAAINLELESDQQRLAALIRDRERLNTLLVELQALAKAAAPVVAPAAELKPFTESKGRLPMPVSGNLTNRFGGRRNADIRWKGWLIAAEEGEPVQAVHGGQIIYADWLRGQGLLMVVDHGAGWLSLYAQSHSLLRSVGDRVNAGDVIARAGASGGSEISGLYFEIRHDGRPIDPTEWIRR
jgi:septal ring factor EnvC (AmiA/AmiB activator)